MRFNKGDKVEVLNKREDHAESWWCAEIISGSGHKYSVRYDRDLPGVISWAGRKNIRPSPPLAMGRLDWVPGDIVEVFDNFSWKLAKIVMFYGQERFFVRLLGSPTELVVNSCGIRLRQFRQDNIWVSLQKDSAKCNNMATNRFSKEIFDSEVQQLVNGQFQAGNKVSFKNASQIVAMGVKKRSKICSCTREKCSGAPRTWTVIEKGRHQARIALKSTRWNKVDAVASPQTLFGEKYMQSSLINKKAETLETYRLAHIANRDYGCSRIMLETSDAESISSSVGSCSIIKSPCRFTVHTLHGMGQDVGTNCDLLEDSTTLGREASFPTDEALAKEIRSIELHAYRCTMAALYASGPISWEQEALLTNLRLMLHISNNEHSMELKNLVSAQTSDFVR